MDKISRIKEWVFAVTGDSVVTMARDVAAKIGDKHALAEIERALTSMLKVYKSKEMVAQKLSEVRYNYDFDNLIIAYKMLVRLPGWGHKRALIVVDLLAKEGWV